MGKFINTVRKDTMTNIVDGYKDRLKNPYYVYSDKKATIVEYFSINKESSTLDDGLKIAYQQVGDNSPFRYNHIKDFYMYDIDQIQLQIENDDFGLEAETITGTGIILPNTIVPVPGDLFKISYLDNSYLFKIITVNADTIESGANFYKIDYEFYKKNDSDLKDLIDGTFSMIVNNIGTDFNIIIKSDDYNYISIMEEISIRLKQYYRYLFYNARVESFILNHKDVNMYDPYSTEFIIRNGILEGDDEYMYLIQQISLPLTFNIDYDNTMFRSIETHKLNNSNNNFAYGVYVNQPLSLLGMKKEEYFYLKYIDEEAPSINEKIEIFNKSLIDNINNSTLYDISDDSIDDEIRLSNFIIKYFNNIDISIEDLDVLQNLKYQSSIYLFYYIPIIIFILEYYIKRKLTK